MGEIADLIINGGMCSECGVYFEEEHEFPVLCSSCWKEAKQEGRVKKMYGSHMTKCGKQKHIFKEI